MINFKTYSNYYDLLYQGKETDRECSYVKERLHFYNSTCTDILELGAGTGRHGLEFLKQGYRWKGIERSPEMIRIGNKHGLEFIRGDISNFNLRQKFDAVIALFHVISYLTKNEILHNTFRNAYKHLKDKGIFLFDIWYTPAVYTQKPEIREKIVENNDIKVRRKAIPEINWNENVVIVNYDVEITDKSNGHKQNFKESHPMRHFTLPEIKYIARSNQFDFLEAEEWITGKEPGPDTWGVTIILRKNE